MECHKSTKQGPELAICSGTRALRPIRTGRAEPGWRCPSSSISRRAPSFRLAMGIPRMRPYTRSSSASPAGQIRRSTAISNMAHAPAGGGSWRCSARMARRQFERLPLLAQDAVRRGHEVSAHGWRWEGHADLDESEERDRIARTVAAIKAVTGTRPVGWHTRSPGSVNTRRLLVEEGGFLYDSDAYNDDLPYFVQVGDKRHLVLPYAFDTNDMQFFHTNRLGAAADFAAYAIDAFDWLHREGAHAPKMMSIGLHLRIIGRPGRIGALDRILRHITNRGDAWIARRVDIANHWLAQFP